MSPFDYRTLPLIEQVLVSSSSRSRIYETEYNSKYEIHNSNDIRYPSWNCTTISMDSRTRNLSTNNMYLNLLHPEIYSSSFHEDIVYSNLEPFRSVLMFNLRVKKEVSLRGNKYMEDQTF